MAGPTQEEVHVNRPLTNMSVALQAEFVSVGDRMFPEVPVSAKSDTFWKYDTGDINRTEVKPRAPATESEGIDYALSEDSYNCVSYALHKDIADEERANTDSPLDADMDAMRILNHSMKLKKELEFANSFFTTGVWTGSTTGSDIVPSTKWDASNSTPIEEITAQIRSVHTKTGFKPNKLVIGAVAWDALKNNAQFLGRLSSDELKNVTRETLARILEIDEVIVGEVVYNTANQGGTLAMTQMYGERALLCYTPKVVSTRMPASGLKFVWKKAGLPGTFIRKMRIDLRNCDRLELQGYWQYKLISSTLGVLFDNVLST